LTSSSGWAEVWASLLASAGTLVSSNVVSSGGIEAFTKVGLALTENTEHNLRLGPSRSCSVLVAAI
jgi:hypothetical protein